MQAATWPGPVTANSSFTGETDGQIRGKDTYGHGPFPPKDTNR